MVRIGNAGATHITATSALMSHRRATLLLAAVLSGRHHRQGGTHDGKPTPACQSCLARFLTQDLQGVPKAQAEPANDPATRSSNAHLVVCAPSSSYSFIHQGDEGRGRELETRQRPEHKDPRGAFAGDGAGGSGGKGAAGCSLGEGDRSGGQRRGPGASVLEGKDHRGHQCGFPQLKEAFIVLRVEISEGEFKAL